MTVKQAQDSTAPKAGHSAQTAPAARSNLLWTSAGRPVSVDRSSASQDDPAACRFLYTTNVTTSLGPHNIASETFIVWTLLLKHQAGFGVAQKCSYPHSRRGVTNCSRSSTNRSHGSHARMEWLWGH